MQGNHLLCAVSSRFMISFSFLAADWKNEKVYWSLSVLPSFFLVPLGMSRFLFAGAVLCLFLSSFSFLAASRARVEEVTFGMRSHTHRRLDWLRAFNSFYQRQKLVHADAFPC